MTSLSPTQRQANTLEKAAALGKTVFWRRSSFFGDWGPIVPAFHIIDSITPHTHASTASQTSPGKPPVDTPSPLTRCSTRVWC